MSSILDCVHPDDLAQTENLELLSRHIVDGFLTGRHRSKHKGGGAEFAEHRAYYPGDEIRLLDWRVFGKSDRYMHQAIRGGNEFAGHRGGGRQRLDGFRHEHADQIPLQPRRRPVPGPAGAPAKRRRRPGRHGRRPARPLRRPAASRATLKY